MARYLIMALIIVLPLYIWGTFGHDLWRPTEAREAGIAREMIENGNWTATHLNGMLFLEKPPLYTWAVALCLKLFGYHDWTVRIPAFIFTMGILILMFVIARQGLSPLGASAATVGLGTMCLYSLFVYRSASMDPACALRFMDWRKTMGKQPRGTPVLDMDRRMGLRHVSHAIGGGVQGRQLPLAASSSICRCDGGMGRSLLSKSPCATLDMVIDSSVRFILRPARDKPAADDVYPGSSINLLQADLEPNPGHH